MLKGIAVHDSGIQLHASTLVDLSLGLREGAQERSVDGILDRVRHVQANLAAAQKLLIIHRNLFDLDSLSGAKACEVLGCELANMDILLAVQGHADDIEHEVQAMTRMLR